MTPRFILPKGHSPCKMKLILKRIPAGSGWGFFGLAEDGTTVPARDHHHKILNWAGKTDGFHSRADADLWACCKNLPPYAVWNQRRKCLDGEALEIMAYPEV